MNPLYAGALARALILIAGTSGVTLSESDAVVVISALFALGSVAWSLKQKQQQIERER